MQERVLSGQERTDFGRYQYAALAARLASSQESSRFAPGALEVLAGSKGLNLGEESLGFVRGTQASEEGIQKAINVYAKQFEEKRGAYKPSELASWYGSVFSGLDKTEKDKILALLNYDETIKEIREKLQDALVVSKASDRLFTPEKKAEAKKIIEKYQTVFSLMETLDSYKFESLRGDAVDTERTNTLKDMASKL